jgi:hypothetical protein
MLGMDQQKKMYSELDEWIRIGIESDIFNQEMRPEYQPLIEEQRANGVPWNSPLKRDSFLSSSVFHFIINRAQVIKRGMATFPIIPNLYILKYKGPEFIFSLIILTIDPFCLQ